MGNFVTDTRINPILNFLKRAIKIDLVHFFVPWILQKGCRNDSLDSKLFNFELGITECEGFG